MGCGGADDVVMEPVQDGVRSRYACSYSSVAGLDRAEHLGIHRAGRDSDGFALLQPGGRKAVSFVGVLALYEFDRV